MPENAGKLYLQQAPRGVTSISGIGGPVYRPCTRALSIDGGGVRGIIPAMILAEIERKTGKPIAAQFDIIAGTSTGSILALGLTRPVDNDSSAPAFSADKLVEFFSKDGAEVFHSPHSLVRKLRQIFYPKYEEKGIDSILKKYFGNVRLGEALTWVFVPAYDIEDHSQIWFNSSNGRDVYMRDVVRGSTAAPSYLPPVRFAVPSDISRKGYVALVDGGLFANNPSPKALEKAMTLSQDRLGNDHSVLIVSIGTGTNPKKYAFEETYEWGALDWIPRLLDVMFDVADTDKQMRVAANKPNIIYKRLEPDLKNSDIPLDDSSSKAIQSLKGIATEFLETHNDEIDSIVTLMSLPQSPQCGIKPGLNSDRPSIH